MGTALEYGKTGLKILTTTSSRPSPRVQALWPIPPIPIDKATLIDLALEPVAETGRKGIRITSRGSALPGDGSERWTLLHASYQGSEPSLLNWEEIPVGLKINLLVDQPMSSATHRFRLRCDAQGRSNLYPEVSIQTPADGTQGDLSNLKATIADMTSDGKITDSEKVQLRRWLEDQRQKWVSAYDAAVAAGMSTSAEPLAGRRDNLWKAAYGYFAGILYTTTGSFDSYGCVGLGAARTGTADIYPTRPVGENDPYKIDNGAWLTMLTGLQNAPLAVRSDIAALPATSSVKGLVKPGAGLTVAADGTLQLSGGGSATWAGLGGAPTDSTPLMTLLNGKVATTDPRLSDARPASDVYSWAKAATKPAYTAAEVGALATGGTAYNADRLGTYLQDLQTVVGDGDYLLVRNQTAGKISLASAASVAAIVQGAATGSWAISADTVDGLHGSDLARKNADTAFTAVQQFASQFSDPWYATAAIQVRERAYATNTGTSETFADAPRIGWHWAGRYAANLAYLNDGFHFMDHNCGAYKPVSMGALTATGVIRSTSAYGWQVGETSGVPRVIWNGNFDFYTDGNGWAPIRVGALTASGVADIAGQLYLGGFSGPSKGSIYKQASYGLAIAGTTGAAYDLTLMTPAAALVMTVPTGTNSTTLHGVTNILGGSSLGLTFRSNGIQTEEYNGLDAINFNYRGYLNGTTQFRDFKVWDGKQGQIMGLDGATKAATFAGALKISGTMWDFNANGVFYFGNTSGWLTWDTSYAALISASGKDLWLKTSSSGKGITINQSGMATLDGPTLTVTNAAGAFLQIGTGGNNGSDAAPLYHGINFIGASNYLTAQITCADQLYNRWGTALQFYTRRNDVANALQLHLTLNGNDKGSTFAGPVTMQGLTATWGTFTDTVNIDGTVYSTEEFYAAGDKQVMRQYNAASGTDLNTLSGPGAYRINGSHPNSPGSWGQMMVVYGGSDTIAQMYFDHSSGSVYSRAGNPAIVGGSGAWTDWAQHYTTRNIDTAPASLQALKALGNAPAIGPLPLPTLPSTTYPVGSYYYATDDTTADGQPGTLYKNTAGTWTMVGASLLIAGRIIAANITAGSIGATALASEIVLATIIRTTTATWVGTPFASGSYLSAGAMLYAASGGGAAGIYCGDEGIQIKRARIREANFIINRITNGLFYSNLNPWVTGSTGAAFAAAHSSTSRTGATGSARATGYVDIADGQTLSLTGAVSFSQLLKIPSKIVGVDPVLKLAYLASTDSPDVRLYNTAIGIYVQNVETGASEQVAATTGAITADGAWHQVSLTLDASKLWPNGTADPGADFILKVQVNYTEQHRNQTGTGIRVTSTVHVDEVNLTI